MGVDDGGGGCIRFCIGFILGAFIPEVGMKFGGTFEDVCMFAPYGDEVYGV